MQTVLILGEDQAVNFCRNGHKNLQMFELPNKARDACFL
jgi:hypothetical protein